MPRFVDHEQRRRDIIEAARHLLAVGGPAELTIRGVAKRLGGSITMVTHYFPTRPELMRSVLTEMLDDYRLELEALEESADPAQRLRILLRWMLPLTEEDWAVESGRIRLLSQRGQDSTVEEFVNTMDPRMRDLLQQHLAPLVAPQRLAAHVDLLRVVVNGIVLAAVEHHDDWPADRQVAVLEHALEALGL